MTAATDLPHRTAPLATEDQESLDPPQNGLDAPPTDLHISAEPATADRNLSGTPKVDTSRTLRQMAKLKFCTEPPKPVSINPREFISQINHNKMVLLSTPCFCEAAGGI